MTGFLAVIYNALVWALIPGGLAWLVYVRVAERPLIAARRRACDGLQPVDDAIALQRRLERRGIALALATLLAAGMAMAYVDYLAADVMRLTIARYARGIDRHAVLPGD